MSRRKDVLRFLRDKQGITGLGAAITLIASLAVVPLLCSLCAVPEFGSGRSVGTLLGPTMQRSPA